jgi:hypothetical protein
VVAEIGQQLAWIMAVFQLPPEPGKFFYCIPRIGETSISWGPPCDHFTFGFQYYWKKLPEHVGTSLPGQCWRNLFQSPVVVKGYPIPRRKGMRPGLEAPLDLLASLIGTKKLDRFRGSLFLKGFSAMLVATEQDDEYIMWHLLFKEDGTYIDYTEVSVDQIPLDLANVEGKRHIVGWCSQVEIHAGKMLILCLSNQIGRCPALTYFFLGDSGANCPVRNANLLPPADDIHLQTLSLGVSGGKYLTPSVTFGFALGIKDKPIHIPGDGYIANILEIDRLPVIFWDHDCKRGWLVNGSSALLQLARHQWKSYEDGKMGSLLCNKPDKLEDPVERYNAGSALQVLGSHTNRAIPLWKDKPKVTAVDPSTSIVEWTYKTFQDMVEEIYGKMFQMRAHNNTAEVAGWSIKPLMQRRRRFHGWNFDDVISKSTFEGAIEIIPSTSHGWVDLIQHIQAITIFGNGFGQLIKPSSTQNHCPRWTELPRDRYYLAACMSELAKIEGLGHFGTDRALQLTSGTTWRTSQDPFPSCACQQSSPQQDSRHKSSSRQHSDLSHELHKTKGSGGTTPRAHLIGTNGAVIFRHNLTKDGISDQDDETVEALVPQLDPLSFSTPGDDSLTTSRTNQGSDSIDRSTASQQSVMISSATSPPDNASESPKDSSPAPKGPTEALRAEDDANDSSTARPEGSTELRTGATSTVSKSRWKDFKRRLSFAKLSRNKGNRRSVYSPQR